jgi:hypothetical protein
MEQSPLDKLLITQFVIKLPALWRVLYRVHESHYPRSDESNPHPPILSPNIIRQNK